MCVIDLKVNRRISCFAKRHASRGAVRCVCFSMPSQTRWLRTMGRRVHVGAAILCVGVLVLALGAPVAVKATRIKYASYAQIVERLHALEQAHPEFVEVSWACLSASLPCRVCWRLRCG